MSDHQPDIFIGIPTLDGKLHSECLIGVLEAWGKYPCRIEIERGSFLPKERDTLLAHFLADPSCGYMLCVDSDIEWHAKDLEKLLALNKPFTAGYYRQKFEGGALCVSGPMSRIDDFSTHRARTYQRVGAGFILLTREAAQAMWDHYLKTDSYEDRGETLVGLWQTCGISDWTGPDGVVKRVAEGEDFAFCRRWRQMGGEIYVHADVLLGHVGPKIWRPGER